MSVYNGAKLLPRAIDSVLAQTWTDFEFIIVDDGSTDETPSILNAYQQADRRVRIITQANAGLTRALIRGCAEARGIYIARHDADDWSEPTRFAEQIGLLESDPAIGFVSCTTQGVGPNGEPLEVAIRSDGPAEATRKLLEIGLGPPGHGSVIFRRCVYEKVGGYRPEFYFGQDYDLWVRMAQCSQLAFTPTLLYTWLRSVNGISGMSADIQQVFGDLGRQCLAARQNGRSETEILATARQLCETARARQQRSHSRRSQSTMAYLIGATLKSRSDRRAISYFWQAILLYPLNWRAWTRLFMSLARTNPLSQSQSSSQSLNVEL